MSFEQTKATVGAPAPSDSTIDNRIRALSNTLYRLQSNIAALGNKLEPVLTPEAISPEGDSCDTSCAEAITSPLADKLLDLNYEAMSLESAVQNIVGRLEL